MRQFVQPVLNTQHPLALGLRGLWMRSRDERGNIIHDLTGRNNATMTGATFCGAKGRRNGYAATNFVSASSQFGQVAHHANLNPAGDFTFGCWARTTTTATMRMMQKETSGARNFGLLEVGTQAYLFIEMAGAGASPAINAGPSINDGLWHFIVGQRQGSTAYLYVDGKQAGSAAVGTASITATAPIALGYNNNGSTQYWNGQLDSWFLYDRAVNVSALCSEFRRGLVGLLKRPQMFVTSTQTANRRRRLICSGN